MSLLLRWGLVGLYGRERPLLFNQVEQSSEFSFFFSPILSCLNLIDDFSLMIHTIAHRKRASLKISHTDE